MKQLSIKPVEQVVDFLKSQCNAVPEAAIVLGSGVKVLDDLQEAKTIPYAEVFGAGSGVVGHASALTLGKVNGKLIMVLRGRFHLYEGYDWDFVTLPTRAVIEWGIPKLYLTNAAGGMNPSFKVGDLMVLTGYRDHLNSEWQKEGLLPAIHQATIEAQNDLVKSVLQKGKELSDKDKSFRPLKEGVYAGLLGPNYETLAEIAMLQKLKADAVGMSTVPELLTARHTKTIPAAVSVITNVWSPDEVVGGHEEVLQAAKEASERLDKLFRALI